MFLKLKLYQTQVLMKLVLYVNVNAKNVTNLLSKAFCILATDIQI